MTPERALVLNDDTSATLNLIQSSTPASSALAFAALIAAGFISDPYILRLQSLSIAS